MKRLLNWWHKRKVKRLRKWREKALSLGWTDEQLFRIIRHRGVDPEEVTREGDHE